MRVLIVSVSMLVGVGVVITLSLPALIRDLNDGYRRQAVALENANIVQRELLKWQTQIASLDLLSDYAETQLQRGLLERQMAVVARLSTSHVERIALARVRAKVAVVERIYYSAEATAASRNDADRAWRKAHPVFEEMDVELQRETAERQEGLKAAVAAAGARAGEIQARLRLTVGLLVAAGFALALLVRKGIRDDFKVAYESLQVEMDDRVAAEQALVGREAHFRSLVQNSTDVVTVLAADGLIRYQSDSVTRNLGVQPQARVGRNILDFIQEQGVVRRALSTCGAGDPLPLEFSMQDGAGGWRPMQGTMTNLLGVDHIDALVLNYRDVTERKHLEAALLQRATHDSLTGLPNRSVLPQLTEEGIARSASSRTFVGVAVIDVDDFKQINDTYGHRAGDSLLTILAQRFRGAIRSSDMVARLGGDEFALVLDRVTSDADLRQRLARLQQAMVEPVALGSVQISVTVSIGVAMAPAAGWTYDELMQSADIAMYVAKQQGKASWVMFRPEMRDEVAARTQLQSDLAGALDRGEFSLAYQPVIDLQTGAVVSTEALLRWTHPVRGQVSPAEFIPAAEATTLMQDIGSWVLERACRDARGLITESPSLTVAVNVSAQQLVRADFVQEVQDTLAITGLPPANLILEITESVLLADEAGAKRALAELRGLGVHLALDDFGVGFSSLNYLRFLPVEILKIDKSFVDGIGRPHEDALLKMIIEMGESLGLTVVAEGVELEDQATALRGLGCHRGQGYLFARPMPIASLVDVLELGRLTEGEAVGGRA